MKIKLSDDIFRIGKKGEVVDIRNDDHATMFIESGKAKEAKDSDKTELEKEEAAKASTKAETQTTGNAIADLKGAKDAKK